MPTVMSCPGDCADRSFRTLGLDANAIPWVLIPVSGRRLRSAVRTKE